MAEKRMVVCDRCGGDASARTDSQTTPIAVQRLTIHAHHDRKIDLCSECKDRFFAWLDDLRVRRESLG